MIHRILVALLAAAAPAVAGQNWPQWRGPLGTGVSPDARPPVEWSETKNVRWKTALSGLGHSTPIVWGDRVYVTTAVPYGEPVEPKPDSDPGAHDNLPVTRHHRYVAIALDRRNGKIVWKKTVHQDLPHEGGHESGSLASASPVTDGELVFAFFGSRGLFCLDRAGEVKWKRDLGDLQTKHNHGEGASPVLHGDTLVVNWDHEGESFVVAFDKRTGKERWKVARDERTSWTTPIVVVHDGRPQVIVSATKRIRAYDLATGKVIWECGGLSNNVVASPVAADGILIAGSSYVSKAMVAVRLEGARGDVTGTDQIAWTRERRTPYVPSPLLYGGAVWYLRHYQPTLSRVEVKTGMEPAGPFSLGGIGSLYASPVGADGRIYLTDLRGATLVISNAVEPKALALNRLDEPVNASAALAGKAIFLRGNKSLYCIAEE